VLCQRQVEGAWHFADELGLMLRLNALHMLEA
jgi:hypothetical protein